MRTQKFQLRLMPTRLDDVDIGLNHFATRPYDYSVRHLGVRRLNPYIGKVAGDYSTLSVVSCE